jgi:hypothetical protein
MSDRNGMAEYTDDQMPTSLRRDTAFERVVRFLFGAVPAFLVMLFLSPLLEPLAAIFFPITAVVAVIAGAACATWGDRFLGPFLRAIDRIV